ncbi:MAG: GTP cyclohydrolase II [Candidatus Methanofastidiosia archaeon]|jgi:GTP cyclohydrolase II
MDTANNTVTKLACAAFPTRFGDFVIYAFQDYTGKEHIALVRGEVSGKEGVPVRIHSECLTGDCLGSLRCDCRDQLEYSLKYLGQKEYGILLYMRQEGRGIGLGNKIKAYHLQDNGMDTVEANIHLGFDEDLRDYSTAAHILQVFNVKSVALLTNNPAKVQDLKENGITITKRIPVVVKPNKYNTAYLKTKKKKMNHLIE